MIFWPLQYTKVDSSEKAIVKTALFLLFNVLKPSAIYLEVLLNASLVRDISGMYSNLISELRYAFIFLQSKKIPVAKLTTKQQHQHH